MSWVPILRQCRPAETVYWCRRFYDGPEAMGLKRWQVTASRYLLRDKWLAVRADDCVTETGAKVAPHDVLEYPDWAHAAAFSGNGHRLVVRQYRHALGRVCVELPGGVIETGEFPQAMQVTTVLLALRHLESVPYSAE